MIFVLKMGLLLKLLALGFADDFASFQGSGKGAYLSYVTADTAVESSKSVAKPSALEAL